MVPQSLFLLNDLNFGGYPKTAVPILFSFAKGLHKITLKPLALSYLTRTLVHAPTNFRIRKLSQLIVVSQGEFVQDRDLDLDLESL